MSGTIGIAANTPYNADEGNGIQLGTYVTGPKGTYVICEADQELTQYDAVAIAADFGVSRLDTGSDAAGMFIGVVDRDVTSGNFVAIQVTGWAIVQAANALAANDQLFTTATEGEVGAAGGIAIHGAILLAAEGTGTAPDGSSVAEGFGLVQLGNPYCAY